jgi:outer membrane protein assembly factor BamE (lipoprotein component of BamABCDE complex)
MPLRTVLRRSAPIAMATLVGLSLAACTSGLSLTQNKARGYEISEDAVKQIRVGQSAQLVTAVLGSPQATNNFGDEMAWYYLGEKVQQTAFGMQLAKERTLLAIYFDKNGKVTDTERLGIKDGKTFNIESRRTPSYGQDRSFIDSLVSSF